MGSLKIKKRQRQRQRKCRYKQELKLAFYNESILFTWYIADELSYNQITLLISVNSLKVKTKNERLKVC